MAEVGLPQKHQTDSTEFTPTWTVEYCMAAMMLLTLLPTFAVLHVYIYATYDADVGDFPTMS
ncbi:hypothetical protein DAEQUDRAFT_728490 [Daedalea quercina L-15889]|uniref:Uncharacterized protein n=1 Tax=Daedalea quercina L-15889 TaxID=1314783 RepID=A0A165PAK7_9APHY|nr:hypothetical protein DAEQUDRAFT_728490 [Daedalea quercina L-15889]